MADRISWLSDVIKTLENLGGEAHYKEIYKEAENIRRARSASWPPSAKEIIRRTLEEQSSDTDSFKGKDLFFSTQGIGNGVWGLRESDSPISDNSRSLNFRVNKVYDRPNDIHSKFGGSRRSGICPCKNFPFIFIFTGSTGSQYGYNDDWDENGVFHYTGEVQFGDMKFSNGNKAIRDHIEDNRDILLFEKTGKARMYKYLGQFVCTDYEIRRIPDKQGGQRNGIIFKLESVEREDEYADRSLLNQSKLIDLSELRRVAYVAADNHKQKKTKENSTEEKRRSFLQRDENIKRYILTRAKGKCECCGEPAPFIRDDQTPYLESHHIFKLSDKGLDHPRNMAALTPNCHREIHFGFNGREKDEHLSEKIAEIEDQLDESLGRVSISRYH